MKIGIYDPYLDTLTGGERYMLSIASCLSSNNDVFIFWNDEKILEKAGKRFDLNLKNITIRPNIFVKEVSIFQKLYETKKYDLIFYLSDGSIPYVGSKKLVLHFQFPVNRVDGLSFKNILKMNRVSDVICNSYFTKKYIDRTFQIQSLVIYPPINLIKGFNENKKKIILSIGRYSTLPNGTDFKKLHFLINAFKKFVDDFNKEYELHLVVSYLDINKENIKKLFLEIDGYPIIIHENLSLKDISSLMNDAKIYWHAAGYGEDVKKYPEYTEHFGIAVAEAMQYSVVPVVFNAGGLPEIVTHADDGFIWNDEKELLTYTNQLISDHHLWKKFAIQAKKNTDKFSLSRFCQQVYELVV